MRRANGRMRVKGLLSSKLLQASQCRPREQRGQCIETEQRWRKKEIEKGTGAHKSEARSKRRPREGTMKRPRIPVDGATAQRRSQRFPRAKGRLGSAIFFSGLAQGTGTGGAMGQPAIATFWEKTV